MRGGDIATWLTRRARARAAGLALLFAVPLTACALEHDAAARFVDRRLRSQGPPEVASRARGGSLVLGAWVIRDIDVTRHRARRADRSSVGHDAVDGAGEGVHMTLRVDRSEAEGRGYHVECDGRRSPPPSPDYAAMVDESHDAVTLRCELTADGPESLRWVLETAGTLRSNIRGEVRAPDRPGSYEVEVLSRYRLFKLVDREMPVGVAQLWTKAGAMAALTLARPEHLWLSAPEHPDAGLWVAILAAHRFTPLGFDE